MDTMANKPFGFMLFLFCIMFMYVQIDCMNSDSNHLHSFSIDESTSAVDNNVMNERNLFRTKREASDVTATESEKNDPVCEKQKEKFVDIRNKLKTGERLEETHVFSNETKFNLALAWAGENDDGTLIVLTSTSSIQFLNKAESTLWRSTDHGRTWIDWNEHVDHETFRKDDGLQRNPHNPKKVYLISYFHFLYITEDGGVTWSKKELTVDMEEKRQLNIGEALEFHGDSALEDYVAVIDKSRRLFVTYDNFQKAPEMIKTHVHDVKWGTLKSKTEDFIYVTTGDFKSPFVGPTPPLITLERYDKKTENWKAVLHKVISFNVEGKFMYASVYKSDNPKSAEDDQLMMISTDGGDSWKEAQLPTITGDRFFFVLDMSEDLIFMHVDDPGDTGNGTIYTSSSNGVVYSQSLPNHLFPNYNTVHDFYKVKSIRGVYLASQMGPDKSIHTVITYTQGGEWKNLSRPLDAMCENDPKMGCSLQVHNAYSIHRGIAAHLPKSVETAPGVVLAHAHVASNLQTTTPDVYLSSDGGYNFKKVLKGPHAYEIADSGGLLLAIPVSDETPDIIKFSTDEGNCWHTYKFTNQNIKFTGLVTEPGGKSMTVSIWGYTMDTKKWTINVIDFNKVITRQCKSEDYTDWIPHISLNKDTGMAGCLLGQKETFKKVKVDSWCRNGYFKNIEKKEEICPCSKEDYECDFGFYRRAGEEECRRQHEIAASDIEVCNGNELERVVTVGYRKLPGDICDHDKGFHPVSRFVDINALCKPGDKAAITHDKKSLPKNSGSHQLLVGAIVCLVLIVVAVVGAYFLYKIILLRRHKAVYRYSMLNQGEERDNEFENALTNHDTLYHDTSDEEVEQENRSPKHQFGNGRAGNNDNVDSVLPGYHDDSDDDLLG